MTALLDIIAHNAPALVLAGVLCFREWQNWKDRKDLLDRIMCADYQQYKRLTAGKPPAPEFPARMTDAELADAALKLKKHA